MSEPRDSDLIARFKRGDTHAFEVLVDRHMARIVGLARRMIGDAHESMDVAQEVFVACFGVLPTWRDDAQLFTWLYRTTLNLCSKRLRSRGRSVPAGPRDPEAAPAPDTLGRVEMAEAISTALEELSDRQRDVFLSCHERGETLADVATRLGISVGAAKSHLHRALSTLRDQLELRKLL